MDIKAKIFIIYFISNSFIIVMLNATMNTPIKPRHQITLFCGFTQLSLHVTTDLRIQRYVPDSYNIDVLCFYGMKSQWRWLKISLVLLRDVIRNDKDVITWKWFPH